MYIHMYTCIIHIHICTHICAYVYIRKYSPFYQLLQRCTSENIVHFINYYKDMKMARNIHDVEKRVISIVRRWQ